MSDLAHTNNRRLRLAKKAIHAVALSLIAAVMIVPTLAQAITVQDLSDILNQHTYYSATDTACPGGGVSQPETAPGKVYILGDSLTARAEAAITERLTAGGFTFAGGSSDAGINADGGRAISSDTSPPGTSGIDAVIADASIIGTADTIIVELGTNSGLEDLNVQIPALMTEIRKANTTAKVYWVNLFYTLDVSSREEDNGKIANSNNAPFSYTVINALAAGIELEADKIHPTTVGNAVLAQILVNGISTVDGVGTSSTPNNSPTVGNVSKDGNPFHILTYPAITDEVGAAASINNYIASRWPTSPFNGLGEKFISGGKRSNVNPFLAVGHLQKENNFARDPDVGWHGNTYSTRDGALSQNASLKAASNNAFGMTTGESSPHVYYRRSVDSGSALDNASPPANDGYKVYVVKQWKDWAASLDSPSDDVEDWFEYIRRGYLNVGSTYESPDFETYVSHYAPQEDGNSEAAYIASLFGTIDALSTGLTTGVVSSVSGCKTNTVTPPPGVGGAGENGWDLPGEGPNPMTYFYSQVQQSSLAHSEAYTDFYGPQFKLGTTGTIQAAGCGPTSAAMVVSNLTGIKVGADVMGQYFADNGYLVNGGQNGSYSSMFGTASAIEKFAARWGVRSYKIPGNDFTVAAAEIKKGNFVIISIAAPSPLASNFTGAHIAVLRKVTDDGKFFFADPSDTWSKNRNHPIIQPLGSSRTALSPAELGPINSGMYVFEKVTP